MVEIEPIVFSRLGKQSTTELDPPEPIYKRYLNKVLFNTTLVYIETGTFQKYQTVFLSSSYGLD